MNHSFLRKLVDLFLGFWVFVYILFEELIWDSIALPIFKFVHSLQVLQRIETSVANMNRYALLGIFLFLFIQVELLGFFAIALLAKGHLLFGIALYSGKIPIAAFTFWLFRVAKLKLMTFLWLSVTYTLLMRLIDAIKASALHRRIIDRLILLKQRFVKLLPRYWVRSFKESPFWLSINRSRLAVIDYLRSLS